jgi:hypothetical protein
MTLNPTKTNDFRHGYRESGAGCRLSARTNPPPADDETLPGVLQDI